ncbi:dienelactone hydrolase family protein [Rhodococcus zopfii]
MPGSELDATRQWLVAHPQCTGRIGVIGFCMGGGFALAVAADHDFDAASVNYGGLTREVERSLPHACPIVGSFGDKDRWPGVRGVPDRIEPILDAAGIDHDIKVYPGAGHGFLNDHHPDELSATDRAIARIVSARFDEPASRDARTRIVAFFRKHLQGGVGPRT